MSAFRWSSVCCADGERPPVRTAFHDGICDLVHGLPRSRPLPHLSRKYHMIFTKGNKIYYCSSESQNQLEALGDLRPVCREFRPVETGQSPRSTRLPARKPKRTFHSILSFNFFVLHKRIPEQGLRLSRSIDCMECVPSIWQKPDTLLLFSYTCCTCLN